jgi:elongation factor G
MAQEKTSAMSRVRNIGIMAHIDAGKTTVTERLLYLTGRIHRMGEVHDGMATMDWMVQEQERGITITSAVTTLNWRNHDIHLIDTPGHVDFTIEVERSLRVLDGVVTVLDGVAGVEPQTETVWRQADKFNVPRFVFVNKLDRMGASHDRCVASLEAHFGSNRTILPLQIPMGEESALKGVIDLLTMEALTWSTDDGLEMERGPIPADFEDAAREARNLVVERLADFDDDIAMRFLDGEAIEREALIPIIRAGTIAGRLVPVLCGSALKNKGVLPILDAVVDFFPSPEDMGAVAGVHPDTGEPERRELIVKAPLAALAFKVQIMEDGRRMTYVRVYSGRLRVNESLRNAAQGFEEKISRIFVMHANQRQRVDAIDCGNIVGVLGLKKTTTGDTICDPRNPIALESIGGKEPVVYQAVEPMTSRDKEKLDETLDKLAEEDPTFRTFEDKETGERVMAGMGELHLEILVDRLKRQFGLETRVGKPQVLFRETVRSRAEATATFDRVHEDKRIFGKATVRIEPLPRGGGIEFVNEVDNPLFVGEVFAAAREGAVEAAKSGPLEGHAMDDIKVTLVDVEILDGVSSPIAYRIAASEAAMNASRKADPVKMEPIMKVEIVVPDEYLGAAISSINERRGKVEAMHEQAAYRVVEARVPLQAMFGFSTDIRTRTQGRGTFSMEFSRYDIIQ